MQLLKEVLSIYEVSDDVLSVEPFGNGLINNTWKVATLNKGFILQKLNENVFKKPADIAHNIKLLANYFKQYYPSYLFINPVATIDGNTLVYIKDKGYFRMFPFVENSITHQVVETSVQAYEAAVQFGKFTKLLSHFNCDQLRTTIPSFHNLTMRYKQFLISIQKGNQQRILQADLLIQKLKHFSFIVEIYDRFIGNTLFKKRVIHHDTKISNVLFNANDKGLCVIDLDTVMPGYFISDLGDMMRTYLAPVNEEETDATKLEVRDDFYKAIVEGYMSEMESELSKQEKQFIFFSGQFMIYMQAIRFLTDFLSNDSYYGAKYPDHNLNRAMNQMLLLEIFTAKEKAFTSFTHRGFY